MACMSVLGAMEGSFLVICMHTELIWLVPMDSMSLMLVYSVH